MVNMLCLPEAELVTPLVACLLLVTLLKDLPKGTPYPLVIPTADLLARLSLADLDRRLPTLMFPYLVPMDPLRQTVRLLALLVPQVLKVAPLHQPAHRLLVHVPPKHHLLPAQPKLRVPMVHQPPLQVHPLPPP